MDVQPSSDRLREERQRRTPNGADLSRRLAEQRVRVEALAGHVNAIRKHLADLSRRVAVTEDRLAATYERMAQTSHGRAETFRARVQSARQFGKVEREMAEKYEADSKELRKGSGDR